MHDSEGSLGAQAALTTVVCTSVVTLMMRMRMRVKTRTSEKDEAKQ